jgi:hypothetical protein
VAEPIIAKPHCGSRAYPPNHCHALGAVPTSQPAANETTAIRADDVYSYFVCLSIIFHAQSELVKFPSKDS